MTLPFISCICPTYARYPERGWLLEEAVESFLRQDYPVDRRELVVMNDCRQQELVCHAPGVRVINCCCAPYRSPGERAAGKPGTCYMPRFPTLGAKYNALVILSRGDLICPWEDDDISLPHRVGLSVERLGDADYFNPKAHFFSCGETFQHEQMTSYAHNASIFRRLAWEKVGGYPHDCKQDAGMDSRLRGPRHDLRVIDGPLSEKDTFYIYRWGVSDHHVSAFGDADAAYRQYGEQPIVAGRFAIRPHWREDYAAKVVPPPAP